MSLPPVVSLKLNSAYTITVTARLRDTWRETLRRSVSFRNTSYIILGGVAMEVHGVRVI